MRAVARLWLERWVLLAKPAAKLLVVLQFTIAEERREQHAKCTRVTECEA